MNLVKQRLVTATNILRLLFLIPSSIALSFAMNAQVSVSGLDCVVAGGNNGYLYNASGPLDVSDKISWKVTGGIIVSTQSNSLSGTADTTGSIRVIWSNKSSTGTVQLSSSRLGSFTFDVRINSLSNIFTTTSKLVTKGSGVSLTGSSLAGSCVPVYDFWWESSLSSEGPFNDISGAKSADLTTGSITQKTYYRRVFSVNGNVIYSNIITVDVQ